MCCSTTEHNLAFRTLQNIHLRIRRYGIAWGPQRVRLLSIEPLVFGVNLLGEVCKSQKMKS